MLTHAQARKFYDRFGKKQDTQAFYEDAALAGLIAHGAFEQAGSVFELGCGTGRFASRLLTDHLPSTATYFGIDISGTMVGIAEQRLAAFATRAGVALSDGPVFFPLPDRSVDRVVATYVLDLLSETDIRRVIAEARRVLTPNGKLCLVSLTEGTTFVSRIVSGVWSALSRVYAPLVGGCRPVRLEAFMIQPPWIIEYHKVVVQFGVPSEVLVASLAG